MSLFCLASVTCRRWVPGVQFGLKQNALLLARVGPRTDDDERLSLAAVHGHM